MRQGAQGGSDSDGWSGAVLASAGAILREQPVARFGAGGDQVQGVRALACVQNHGYEIGESVGVDAS